MPRLLHPSWFVPLVGAAVVLLGNSSPSRPPDYDTHLESLRDSIRTDRHNVTARRGLAELLEGTEDIELRREAAEALQEALLLETQNADLWLRFARLQERRGFHMEAHDAYQNAADLAPGRWEVFDAISQHEFGRFQSQMLWKHLDDSDWANRQTLQANPSHIPAIRRGVRLAQLRDEPARVDSLCTQWEHLTPLDPWPHLVRGMLQADAGAWAIADASFRRGIELLSESERPPFFRLDHVDPRQEDRRREAPDTLAFFDDYWRWMDPTPADVVNPRLVEHYRRMVKAELLFALERLEVRGWDHAPGEMIVRYGLPEWWTFLGGVARVMEYRISDTMAAPTIEMMFGDETALHPILFVDYSLNGRYYTPIEGFPHSEHLDMVEVPSTYAEPFRAPRRDQEIELWRFVDPQGRGRVEVAVALDPAEWPKEVLERPFRLSSRLLFFDSQWTPGEARIASWAPFSLDSRGRLVGRFELEGGADSLILGVETTDRQESARAADFASLSPEVSPPGLALSDLAFLSGVRFGEPVGAYGWGYGSGIPNPGHVYRMGEPLGLAFEAYDLTADDRGTCTARIRVSVSRETATGWLRVVLGGKKGEKGEAELVFEAQDAGTRLTQLLALDLPPIDPGRYRLRVRVEDTVSHQVGERSGNFTILPRGKSR